jgi:hypothetical protein
MTTATKERTRIDHTDKGEWLTKLLEDVQTEAEYTPAPIAVLRMRTRIFEGMAAPARKAA